MFVSAQWTDASQTTIRAARDDGSVWYVPADPDNADYRLITEGQAADPEEGVEAIAPLAIADHDAD